MESRMGKRRALGSFVVWLALAAALPAASIPYYEAAKSVDKDCTVEMRVRAAKRIKTKEGREFVLLNSSESYEDPNGLTINLSKDVAEKLCPSEPAEKDLMGKIIRADGTVTLFKGRAEIKVTDLAQVQVLSHSEIADLSAPL